MSSETRDGWVGDARRLVAAFALGLLALSVAASSSAQGPGAPQEGADAARAEIESGRSEGERVAELAALRLRERHHFTHRRAYAYGVLGGGVVLTLGLALSLRYTCWYGCPPNARVGQRAAAGLIVGGLSVMVVSSLAVVIHTGSLRAVRRRLVRLSLAPTASRRRVGAELTLTW